MKRILVYGFLGLVGWCGSLFAQSNANAVFDKFRALSGDWEGTVAWSGQPPNKVGAHYYLTGNRSAVVEDLTNDMTSVYYLDGSDLRMTHFCVAQNQPRLKADAFGHNNGSVSFSFVDITNLRSPSAGHVQGLDVEFLASDHIKLQFHFVAAGKERDELLDLRRKK